MSEDNKKMLGTDYKSNSNEFSSTAPNSFPKKNRKDARGNLILKKIPPNIKTKHHAYLKDSINQNQKLVDIIDIESYKKYNLDGDEENEEECEKEKENEKKLEESKVVISKGCCSIF